MSDLADAIKGVLTSPNESDRNGEIANVVDALYFIGRAIYTLAEVTDSAASHGRDGVPADVMAAIALDGIADTLRERPT